MCLVFLALLLASCPAHAQWAVTDQNGQPISQNSDGGYSLSGPLSGTGTCTYPSDLPPDYFYEACVLNPNYFPYLFNGTPDPNRGLSSYIMIDGWAKNNVEGSGYYSNYVVFEAINGTTTTHASAPLTVTFTYTGTGTPPPYLDVLVKGNIQASAWVDSIVQPFGEILSDTDLSTQISASDGLGDSLSALATISSPNAGGTVTGSYLLRLPAVSGVVHVSAPVQLSLTEINHVYCDSNPESDEIGEREGPAQATGVALVTVTAQIDNEAVPINFRQTKATDNGDGTLSFQYKWDSSTGNQADLSQRTIWESVTYKDNPAGNGFFQNNQSGVYCYFPPDPFEGGQPEPTQLSAPATLFSIADDQLYSGFSKPYKEASYVGAQTFYAKNSKTGVQMSLLGPLTITRTVVSVYPDPEGDYYDYTVTKSGTTATLYLGAGR